jgi:hypothetical protein
LWTRPRAPLFRVGGQALQKLDPARAVLVEPRRRALLWLPLLVCCAGFALGDLATLSAAKENTGGLLPAWLDGYRPAALLAFGGGVAWVVLFRRWRGEWPLVSWWRSRWERGLVLIGLFFFLLPFPVVFAPLARVVPGLDGMRVPTRVYPFLSFALALLAARGIDWILARLPPPRRPALLAAISLVLVAELRGPMGWHLWPNRDQIPAIFQRIAEAPGVEAVLHLPIPAYPREAHYMYYSIAHWRPIVNGYSSYEPDTYVEVKQRVRQRLFDPSTLDYLSSLGVTHVAVHPLLFNMPRERRRLVRWERQWSEGPEARLRLVAQSERDHLWELLPPPDQHPISPTIAER